jgi:biotin carboxylase
MIDTVARVLLLLPTATYRAPDFLAAARRLGVEVVVGSEEPQALAGSMGDRALLVPFADVGAATDAIVALHRRAPLGAIVAVDDQGVIVAAHAAARLGIRHNPPGAVAATRDKAAMREALAAAGVPQPAFRVVGPADDVAAAAAEVGPPCVVKPVSLSASRGVIRADDPASATAAADRIRTMVDELLLVERYMPGDEVALEGLLRSGRLEVLAVFDKPDPLEGPFFEETLYVTPSRLPRSTLDTISATSARAAAALGLVEGPVHAELRVDGDRAWMLELAARSIGGLCSRALRFGAGISLEEVILRHALGLPVGGLAREEAASGVLMIPIPHAGVLEKVGGRDAARAVPGVVGLEITIASGRPVVPLPEGDRYLGFVFARGKTPVAVERALRAAHGALQIVIT